MRIALLSGASSIHTIRWANGLSVAGHEVHVISQHHPCDPLNADIVFHKFPFRGVVGYFTMVPAVKKLLNRLQPDVISAHYASGYATTARLVGRRPWVLSVWGTDVYDFPHKSPLHKWLVSTNLLAADAVASTSHCMAEVTCNLAPSLSKIHITPFGVDMAAYEAIEPVAALAKLPLVIGTVKTMANTYGIDTLIEAFAILLRMLASDQPELAACLQLRLVGDGPQTGEYKALALKLGVADKVVFVGRVPHSRVPQELAKLDIYVALSRLESFGVAVIEAGAAGRPVVVSDAGGLPEVTRHNETGLVVPRESPKAAAEAMKRLVLDPQLRQCFGAAGKRHVAENYSWPACVQQMVNMLQTVITQSGYAERNR